MTTKIEKQIESHLKLRLSTNTREINYTLNEEELRKFNSTSVNVINCNEKSIKCLNAEYDNFTYDNKTGFFNITHNKGLEKRIVPFANFLKANNFNKQILVNFNDAEGYNYDAFYPKHLSHQGIIQFTRTKAQRDLVTLFPLSFAFMGLGSPNIPNSKDNKNFAEKIATLAWRGGPSGCYIDDDNRKKSARNLAFVENPTEQFSKFPRLSLIPGLAKETSVNVGFTAQGNPNYAKLNEILKTYIPEAFKAPLTIEDQRMYKYILAVDGNDYPSNLFWALMSNSVVLKVESDWETALCSGLEKWRHYVPVKANVESVLSTIEYLNGNQEECLKIIKNAHDYMDFIMNKKYRRILDYQTINGYCKNLIDISGISDDICFFTSNGIM